MVKNSNHIVVNDEVLGIVKKCITEYLENNPNMKGIHISKNKIIYEIGKEYLRGTTNEIEE